MKKNILILNATIFPVPAVKGGAVETLEESFIKKAQQDDEIAITLVSLADSQALMASAAYPNIRFIWLERPAILEIMDRILTKFFRWVKRDPDLWQKNYFWEKRVAKEALDLLESESFDLVLIENAVFLLQLFERKKLAEAYRGKVYFHSHNLHFRKVSVPEALTGIINISHFLEDNSRHCFGADVPIRVVHNGLNPDLFQAPVPDSILAGLRSKWGIPAAAPIFLFVGRVLPKKGVLELLEAFENLNHPQAHLLLVGASFFGMEGQTAFEKEVAARVSRHPRIRATGFVAHQELGAYYALANAVVLPSIWEEPLGLTMIEAQLAGRPLITTNQGGIPETSRPESSLILSLGSTFVEELTLAMGEILAKPQVWEDKALQAQKWALDHFTEDSYYQQMKQALLDPSWTQKGLNK